MRDLGEGEFGKVVLMKAKVCDPIIINKYIIIYSLMVSAPITPHWKVL